MVRPIASGRLLNAHPGCDRRNESFTFSAGALTPKIFVWVYDHKTIGKDKLLGQATIDVSSSDHLLEVNVLRAIIFFRYGDICNRVKQEQPKCLQNSQKDMVYCK